MIKKVEDWTFAEHQAHSKGVLEGTLLGVLMASLLLGLGLDIFYLLH